jgi:hypothetical protein
MMAFLSRRSFVCYFMLKQAFKETPICLYGAFIMPVGEIVLWLLGAK